MFVCVIISGQVTARSARKQLKKKNWEYDLCRRFARKWEELLWQIYSGVQHATPYIVCKPYHRDASTHIMQHQEKHFVSIIFVSSCLSWIVYVADEARYNVLWPQWLVTTHSRKYPTVSPVEGAHLRIGLSDTHSSERNNGSWTYLCLCRLMYDAPVCILYTKRVILIWRYALKPEIPTMPRHFGIGVESRVTHVFRHFNVMRV